MPSNQGPQSKKNARRPSSAARSPFAKSSASPKPAGSLSGHQAPIKKNPSRNNLKSQTSPSYLKTIESTSRKQKLSPKSNNNCAIARECGSCSQINVNYQSGLEDKYQLGLDHLKKSNVLNLAKTFPVTPSPHQLGYRCYFKLAVRPNPLNGIATATHSEQKARRFQIGLFQPGSHKIIDITSCPLHFAPLQKLLRDLPQLLEESPLLPYSEATRTGDLRYISARSSHLTNEIMLIFVANDATNKNHFRKIVSLLRERGHNIGSAFININPSLGNEIFGKEYIKIAGMDFLRERLLDFDFAVGPGNFFQINPFTAQNIYCRIEQLIGPSFTGESRAWDLYCGVGAITFVLARLGFNVLAIEESKSALANLERAAQKNDLMQKISVLPGKVEHVYSQIHSHFDHPLVISVNPSRKGLAPEVLEYLGKIFALKIPDHFKFVYMSCDINSLGRDLQALCQMGLRLRQVEGFDMFPGTNKMEWLALLTG